MIWKETSSAEETVMSAEDVGLLSPFLFPPLALLGEFAAAILASYLVLLPEESETRQPLMA